MPVALITGASQGLGLALAGALAERGWHLVLDARDAVRLEAATRDLAEGPHRLVPGDVTDAAHRDALVAATEALGGADLLVNNASTLGRSPLPALVDLDPGTWSRLLQVNLVAPMALAAALLPRLRQTGGRIVNISSDAAVEAYEGWGGYAASKAALDHASRTLAAEEPSVRVYALDPGDMRTAMHQDAFPGEDIGDRPAPEHVAVPAMLSLLDGTAPSGRYRAVDLTRVAA